MTSRGYCLFHDIGERILGRYMDQPPLQGPSSWIKSATIHNFRGFADLNLSSFGRINLITGYNNVGKTAILEALQIRAGILYQNFPFMLNVVRGQVGYHVPQFAGADSPWDHWFHDFQTKEPISVTAKSRNGISQTYNIEVIESLDQVEPQWANQLAALLGPTLPPQSIEPWASVPNRSGRILGFETESSTGIKSSLYHVFDANSLRTVGSPPSEQIPSIFRPSRLEPNPNETAQQYGQLQMQGLVDSLLEDLKLIEPRLTRLEMIFTPQGPVLYGDIGLNRMLPLRVMGEGTSKLATIMTDFATVSGGALLIDEVENGFHYSMQQKLWQALDASSNARGVQVFATTHSLECIAAAYEHFLSARSLLDSEFPDFRVFRLERNPYDGSTKAVSLDLDEVGEAIELGFEIR